jgi:hypothetical protein
MPLDAPTDRQIVELQPRRRRELWRAGAERRSLGIARGVRPVSGRWGRGEDSRRGGARAIADCLQFSAYTCKRKQALCQLLHLLDDLPRLVRSRAFKRLPSRSLPAPIQLPPGILLAAVPSAGMLESGAGDTRLLLQALYSPHRLCGRVSADIAAREQLLSGLSDSYRMGRGLPPTSQGNEASKSKG